MSMPITEPIDYSAPGPKPKTIITVVPFDEEIYPSITVQAPITFWHRLKKSVVNLLANTFCSVTNRPYNGIFGTTGAIENNDISPV